LKIEEITNKYSEANPTKLTELFALMKPESPRFDTLSMGQFLNAWINYYYAPASLAPDTIEYLIFMIIVLMSGTNVISANASDVVRETKNIKSFREELLKLIQ
jgi:hypothetical protein